MKLTRLFASVILAFTFTFTVPAPASADAGGWCILLNETGDGIDGWYWAESEGDCYGDYGQIYLGN